MYVFTNTSANQMTFGDLTLAPNATTEFPDDRVAALSTHNLKALNDFANGNPLILKVEYQASVPPVTIGPVSAAPTQQDFNALLAALRAASVIAS